MPAYDNTQYLHSRFTFITDSSISWRYFRQHHIIMKPCAEHVGAPRFAILEIPMRTLQN